MASRAGSRLTQHLRFIAGSSMSSQYTPRIIGSANTLDHRVYIEHNGRVVSAFHDVPLFADANNGIFNMIVEIPRWTNAKNGDLQRGTLQPNQTGCQKGETAICSQLFPPSRIYLELWSVSPNLGRSNPDASRDEGQGRQ